MEIARLKAWLIFSFAVITIMMFCFTTCSMHNDYRISKAISDGADPVSASVAFSYCNSNERVAITKMAQIIENNN